MGTQKDSATDTKEPEIEFDPDETLGPDNGFGAIDAGEPTTTTDNVGEISVEIDVEELISEIEADSGHPLSSGEGSARKRLEEVLEQRRIAHELEGLEELEELEELDPTFSD